MKKIITTVALLTSLGGLQAQESPKDAAGTMPAIPKNGKETEEIIIRRKGGDKNGTITVEIKGDKVTINGKPMAEFKDDNINISRRKMTIINGDNLRFNPNGNYQIWNDEEDNEESVKRAFLGVYSEDAAAGARIIQVVKNSAAEKLGLQEGDIITSIADKKVTGEESLSAIIKTHKPDHKVNISYLHNGEAKSGVVTLGSKTIQNGTSYTISGPNGWSWQNGDNNGMQRLIELDKLEELSGKFDNFDMSFRMVKPKLGLNIQDVEEGNGVKITTVETGSAAEKAGLQKDDVITDIDGTTIKTTDDAREALKPGDNKTAYKVKALRSGSEKSFELKIPKKIKTARL